MPSSFLGKYYGTDKLINYTLNIVNAVVAGVNLVNHIM